MNPRETAERCLKEPHYAFRLNRECNEAVNHVYPYLEAEMETNADLFCRLVFGFEPFDFQLEVLQARDDQDIAGRWTRQTGKSTTFGAKLLKYAWYHPRITALIVAPSMRQSLLFRDRMDPHLKAIPEVLRRKHFLKIQRTKIELTNGSIIYVLPNSLDLIRGYTAHIVLCDEFAMFRNADTLLDGIIDPMFNTTNGNLWILSTPKGKGHRFYEICKSNMYLQHHVDWRRGIRSGYTSPYGLKINAVWRYLKKRLPPEAEIQGELTVEKIDEIVKQFGSPREFQMEYEAQFIEDLDTFLSYDLIKEMIDTRETRKSIYVSRDALPEGRFFGGVDLGKEITNSVVIVVEVIDDVKFELPNGPITVDNVKNVVHKKVFPLGENYGSVIGYVKYLNDRWKSFGYWLVDQTGVGEFPVEEMTVGQGMRNVEGKKFTLPMKEEMANYAKQETIQRRTLIPYDSELINALNVERYEFTKDGRLRLFHGEGEKDDAFWAWVLAVYASKQRVDTSKPIFKSR